MPNKVLGTFVGKCCDADVVNNNGMYLSRKLFDELLSSEEYKTAIKNRYYIGFLGHPEDPNCMDFRNGCVVMTDMEMKDNGDVYGKFDLIDTPVGKVVKSFIDAGVHFGISIRGAGDVAADGTVDPESFVFRGFDLVTFPAYNDCVPEFQEIAASTDVDKQKAYRKVCNAVKRNLQSINSCEALETIQDQFNENSKEYQLLQDRICEVQKQSDEDLYVQVLEQKVKSMTQAYSEVVRKCNSLKAEMDKMCNEMEAAKARSCRVEDVMTQQFEDYEHQLDKVQFERNAFQQDYLRASDQLRQVRQDLEGRIDSLSKSNEALSSQCKRVMASRDLYASQIKSLTEQNKDITESNLLSKQKITASESELKEKQKSVELLDGKVRKTVAENEKLRDQVSNLEAEVSSLSSSVQASEGIIFEYQKAYADSCAYAAGIRLDNIPVTASTTVEELKSYIYEKASSSVPYRSVESDSEPYDADVEEADGSLDEETDNLVTL